MNQLLKVFLSMSFSGSLVILLLLGCGRLWKNRLSRQWQYYIWLLAIARLLLPFAPQASLADQLFQAADRSGSWAAPAPAQGGYAALPGGEVRGDTEAPSAPGAESGGGPLREAAAVLGENLWLVWLGAALVLAVRKVTIYQDFVRTVRAGGVPVEDACLLDRLAALEEEAGVKRAVELWVNPQVSSPMLLGLLRPCIVLPDPGLSETEFRHTVLHELVHCRRGDLLYKWLAQAALCLHWFNPLAHVMVREINRACEFSCDEAVVARLGPQGARDYGKTLLEAMAAPGKYREALASVTLNQNKALLKERLGAIMAFRKQSKAALGGTILLSVFLCFGAVFAGAYTGDGGQEPVPPSSRHLSRAESLDRSFQRFASFGVAYDPEADAVFYQGERVKLFVLFQPDSPGGGSYSFELCYRDEKAPGSLCLEAVRDKAGGIAGIRPLAKEIADELLGAMEAAGPGKDPHKAPPEELEEEIRDNLSELPEAGKPPSPALEGEDLHYVCMDGAQILERLGVTGKDFPLERADGAVREWAAGLAGEPGAYLRAAQTVEGYVTHLYYTGGGRYPWNLREEDGVLVVNLYSQSDLATADGYCLLAFTAPREYGFRLYLDGTELPLG